MSITLMLFLAFVALGVATLSYREWFKNRPPLSCADKYCMKPATRLVANCTVDMASKSAFISEAIKEQRKNVFGTRKSDIKTKLVSAAYYARKILEDSKCCPEDKTNALAFLCTLAKIKQLNKAQVVEFFDSVQDDSFAKFKEFRSYIDPLEEYKKLGAAI